MRPVASRQQGHDAPRARHDARAEAAGARGRCRHGSTRDFGRWQVPWGEINRFQRISPATRPAVQRCRAEHSGAVRRRAATARSPRSARGPKPGTKRWYGNYGNSFVAVVEFGPRVRARAVTAGGESGHPGLAALQRRGAALRVRRSARGLFLSRPAQGPHRAGVSARRVTSLASAAKQSSEPARIRHAHFVRLAMRGGSSPRTGPSRGPARRGCRAR